MWFSKKTKVDNSTISKKINDLNIQFLAKYVNNALYSEIKDEASQLPINYGFNAEDDVFSFFSKAIYTTLLGYDNSLSLFVPYLVNSVLSNSGVRPEIFKIDKVNELIKNNNYGDEKKDSLYQTILFSTANFMTYGKLDNVLKSKLAWYAADEFSTIGELVEARNSNPENQEYKGFAELELKYYNLESEINELNQVKQKLQNKADSMVGLYFQFHILNKNNVKNTISIDYVGLQNHVKIFIALLDEKIRLINQTLGV